MRKPKPFDWEKVIAWNALIIFLFFWIGGIEGLFVLLQIILFIVVLAALIGLGMMLNKRG